MIYWIHGAYSTKKSFAFVRDRLPAHEHRFFEYDSRRKLAETIDRLELDLRKHKPRAIAGHSLGGTLAALMVARGYADEGVGITAPLGGFAVTHLMPFGLPWALRSTAPIVREIAAHQYTPRFMAISSREDGVVPFRSQRAARGAEHALVNSTHTEALLCDDVVRHLREHLFTPV